MSTPSKKSAPRAIARTKAPSNAERRSNAAEAARVEGKEARIRGFMAESRKREAELTKQGYCF